MTNYVSQSDAEARLGISRTLFESYGTQEMEHPTHWCELPPPPKEPV